LCDHLFFFPFTPSPSIRHFYRSSHPFTFFGHSPVSNFFFADRSPARSFSTYTSDFASVPKTSACPPLFPLWLVSTPSSRDLGVIDVLSNSHLFTRPRPPLSGVPPRSAPGRGVSPPRFSFQRVCLACVTDGQTPAPLPSVFFCTC